MYRQAAAVPHALVTTDLHRAPDVGGDLTAEVTFDLVVGLDPVAELHQLLVTEVTDPQVRADAGGLEGLDRAGPADAEDVSQGDLEPLVAGQVDAYEACHLGRYSCRFGGGLRQHRSCEGGDPGPASEGCPARRVRPGPQVPGLRDRGCRPARCGGRVAALDVVVWFGFAGSVQIRHLRALAGGAG